LERRAGIEDGFALIEMTVASTIFVLIAIAFAATMSTAARSYQTARSRTLAHELATEQVEEARRLDYDELGTVSGNPPGVLEPTRIVDLDGYRLRVTTTVTYVDDPLPGGFQSSANYKLVKVEVTPEAAPGLLLADFETKVAPPTQPSLNKAVVEIQVLDGSNLPIPGTLVRLQHGPSADRTAVSDAEGWVVFAGLDPNPTSGLLTHYDITPEVAGYVVHADDASKAHVQLAPSQRLHTGIRMVLPVNAIVTLTDSVSGAPFVGATTLELMWGAGNRATTTITGGTLTITALNGHALSPNEQFTLSAYAAGGWFSPGVTQLVPDAYPTDLDSTFSLPMTHYTTALLRVRVRESGTLKRINGATVTIEGGPAAIAISGLTANSVDYQLTLPVSGAAYTVSIVAAGYNATESTVSLPSGGTLKTFNMTKASG
jgi:type II secretory pathway pseudopilin PulG